MNKQIFDKTMKNVREHRDIKFVTTEKTRNYLLLEPNYHTTKLLFENLLSIEMEKSYETSLLGSINIRIK